MKAIRAGGRGELDYPKASRYLHGAVAVTLFCLGLVAAAWWATFSRVEFEAQEAIRAAERQNANLALAYEEHITRTLRGVDQVVGSIVRAVEAGGGRNLQQIVDGISEDPDVSTVIGVVGLDGHLVARNRPRGRNLADRDYFRRHAAHRGSELLIGHPIRGRVSGEWVIPVTRRIDAPDGSFAGIVLASVRPEYFTQFYGRADLGADGVVTIIGLDGTALVRRTRTRSTMGIDMRNSTVFTALKANPHSGTIVSRGLIEGVPRIFSYRRLSGYPVVVAVGTSLGEVLAEPRARERDYKRAAALLTVVALLFLSGYLGVSHRHRKSIQALIRSEQALSTSQRIAQLGSWEVQNPADGRVEDCPATWSEEVYRILGYDDVRTPASTGDFFRRVHPDDLERVLHAAREAMESTGVLDIQHRIVRPDGTERMLHTQGRVMRDRRSGRIVETIGTVRDITEQKALERQLIREANYDALTGLPNRRLFQDRLDVAVTRARRRGSNIAVLFVDVDRFKAVNDTLGHAVGDELLKEIARRLSHCVRGDDTIARLGGDEFAVIVQELAESQDASRVTEKMIRALEAPALIAGHELVVTASIGIASYPGDSADAEALMKNADTAMYRAKEMGPNLVQFYTHEMNERALARLLMVAQLKRAVERSEFQIVYQPRFETRSRRMTGCEALLRWVRDGAEVAAPTEFVPLLESSGLMPPIGAWLIASICDQIRAWIDQGLAPVPVAFNASGRQFDDHALPETVRRALERARLPAALLEMEITESTIMHRPDESEAIVRRLREIGIGIAIDDFGTGYSSLSRLRRFPITALKIDRSFIAGVPGTDDASITRAIITMAHSLQLAVVAEGVETEAQYQFLAAHACDEIQGYYFSPAADAASFGKLLRRQGRSESSAQVVAFAPRH